MTTVPLPAARTYGWRTAGDAGRELLLGAAIGMLIVVVEHGSYDVFPTTVALFRNAILGSFAIAGARGLETALSWALEQSRVATLFRTVIYAVGAWIGYFAGVLVASMLIEREERDFQIGSFHFLYALLLSAFLSVLVGLILHHNRKRNDRLKASIERLKEHEFAEKELEIARQMQKRLLPPPVVEHEGFRVTGRSDAAHIVGGDFYDVLRLADGSYAILVADVSGKGIAASLIVASCKAIVPFLASGATAAEVLTRLNGELAEQLQRREFVSMVFVRFHPATGRAELANAGMPDPLLIDAGRAAHVAAPGERLPLGAMRNVRYDQTDLTLLPGQRLLLFSDGLPEATIDGAPIGYERFEQVAAQAGSLDDIVSSIAGMPGVLIADDVTIVALERR